MESISKSAVVLAYVVALTATFLAGRGFEAQTTPFTHAEVENVAAKCTDKQFIGKCIKCTPCAAYEFSDGGCSGFRDTFCTYCEPIKNCIRENVVCTDRYSSKCKKCNCYDPIKSWGETEIAKFQFDERKVPKGKTLKGVTHACYFGEQCGACKVCPKGTWQTKQCTQTVDTQCKPCTVCKADEWVKNVCTYSTDTVCAACTHCKTKAMKEYTIKRCTSKSNNNIRKVMPFLVQGKDAVCAKCKQCKQGYTKGKNPQQWVSSVCSEFKNTECTDCATCKPGGGGGGGEYIDTKCKKGDELAQGANTKCASCLKPIENYWESKMCISTGTTNTVYSKCTPCILGEWERTKCLASSDAVCPNCQPIKHCPQGNPRKGEKNHQVCQGATNIKKCKFLKTKTCDTDSTCTNCDMKKQWFKGGCCEKGFIGTECNYMFAPMECGTNTYRERSAKRGGFKGKTATDFTLWCKQLCNDFAECTAFEVPAGDFKPTPDSLCLLKKAPTKLGKSKKVACYSKLFRYSTASNNVDCSPAAVKKNPVSKKWCGLPPKPVAGKKTVKLKIVVNDEAMLKKLLNPPKPTTAAPKAKKAEEKAKKKA